MKYIIAAILALLMIPAALSAEPFGAGAFGGALAPVAQDDQGTGTIFGIKARFTLINPLVIEPNLAFGQYGDVTIEGVGGRQGSDLNHYGLDLVLGNKPGATGPKPFLFVGGAVYNIKREFQDTINHSGWSFGGGLAICFTNFFEIEGRGRFNIVKHEGDSSTKSVEITGGLTYYFGAY